VWEPPLAAPAGRYRFLVSARRYRLVSRPFALRPLTGLRAALTRTARGVVVRLTYPPAVAERDFTARPVAASAGTVTLRVGGKRALVRIRHGRAVLRVARSEPVSVVSGRDALGNRLR
jgi:hypothetical protein